MCLDRVTAKLDGKNTMVESGWKYFDGAAIAPQFPHQKWKGTKYCPLGQWIEAEPGKGLAYDAGFHVFVDEAKVRSQRYGRDYRRVYFRRVTAKGIDQGIETVVAQELYVPSKEDTWPKA